MELIDEIKDADSKIIEIFKLHSERMDLLNKALESINDSLEMLNHRIDMVNERVDDILREHEK